MASVFRNPRFFAAASVWLVSNAAFAQMQEDVPPPVALPAADPAAPDPTDAPTDAPAVNPSAPPPTAPAPLVFDSQVAFSPTYSSGYYYASPYAGYTSLSYYGSIYTSRRFGG